ncbi:MAG: tripartite tricarboxylate transporter substrate binding protein [Polaromonas sp.]|uniref:Bug family tripartite tricarboxylate transporter substrate binding protein n=1 Tax=Polaromonas sp. TaxID=1869339 RepID=UPI0025D7002F|nr:tripartite tricarboxylate transporter substrate binding protein [Polaromonas sp.]MBI2728372.1 tripartite tricarboxylate transporter substrate binding protein [Polaromonas sp.]
MNPFNNGRRAALSSIRTLALLTGALCVAAGSSAQTAAAYPAKPVRLIVPFAAGGAVDLIGRQMAVALTEALNQAFVVENRPGAGGLLAYEQVAASAPDGYTLAVGAAGPLSMSPSLYKDRNFDPLTRFDPVIWYASTPGVLVVNPNVKAGKVSELVGLSKASKQQLNMGSAGSGSINHLMGEYFQEKSGIKWLHVPYKGSAPALNELMAGRIDVMMDIVPTASPLVSSGKLRALAVTTPKRSTLLPDTPTLKELGYKDFDVSSWISLMAPRGTPPEVVQKLNAALNKALQTPTARARLQVVGAEAEGGAPERVTQRLQLEIPRWAGIIKSSGAKAD